MNAVQFENVVKRYGSTFALDHLSLKVPKGTITALIGPNGSGKTTTMSLIAGLLKAQSGQVDIFERGPFDINEHGGRIGLMPQDSTPSLSAPLLDSLAYYARLQGLVPEDAQREAHEWLEKVHLGDKKTARFGALSHGMRRRFSVAQALVGRPELILLDEPTSGLDPELVVEIRALIRTLRGACTVLVSSHILSELESMCDYAIILERGKLKSQGYLHELTQKKRAIVYELEQSPDLAQLRSDFPNLSFEFNDNKLRLASQEDTSTARLNAEILPHLLPLGVLEVRAGGSLEEAYLAKKKEVSPSK